MEEYKIIDELKDLINNQTNLAKVRTVQNVKAVRDLADKKVNEIKSYIDNQAKKYGQNSENVTKLKEEYKEAIKGIKEKYQAGFINLEEKRANFEDIEVKGIVKMTVLKKEIKEGKKTEQYKNWKKIYDIYVKEAENVGKTGNMDKYYEKMNEVRRMEKENPLYAKMVEYQKAKELFSKISEYTKNIDNQEKELKKEAKQAIKSAMGDKTTALTKIEKQNIFQKVVGAIKNKINGKKEFINNVENPMKNNMISLKNNIIPGFIGKMVNIVGEKIISNDLKKFKMSELISKSSEKKKTIVNSIAGKLHKANENTQNKIKNINNKQKNNDEEELTY